MNTITLTPEQIEAIAKKFSEATNDQSTQDIDPFFAEASKLVIKGALLETCKNSIPTENFSEKLADKLREISNEDTASTMRNFDNNEYYKKFFIGAGKTNKSVLISTIAKIVDNGDLLDKIVAENL